ncbi:MAG: hypothetical protein JJT93_13280 [Gammaproteobacteria bacterium]|nr:hypothetical protein [Gammaproteobacteria bacterium]TVQ50046.1 MAG: hypothetical protein EA371_01570 [Gammaproteobacteria bacterium]
MSVPTIHALMVCKLLGLAMASYPLPAAAETMPSHYQGLAADSLQAALTHLQSHNSQLAALLAQETLDARDLDTIHRLTYTLENAIARLSLEVVEIAEILEEVHVASEDVDANTVRERGQVYLERTAPLLERGASTP